VPQGFSPPSGSHHLVPFAAVGGVGVRLEPIGHSLSDIPVHAATTNLGCPARTSDPPGISDFDISRRSVVSGPTRRESPKGRAVLFSRAAGGVVGGGGGGRVGAKRPPGVATQGWWCAGEVNRVGVSGARARLRAVQSGHSCATTTRPAPIDS
jgi:hypothetical protein